MDKSMSNVGSSVGYLVWWTIQKQASSDVVNLKSAAESYNLPRAFKSIKGRSHKSAWTAATQIGAKGIKSESVESDGEDTTATYYIRNVDGDGHNIRVLIREVLNSSQEMVDTETVGSIYLSGDTLEYRIQPAVKMRSDINAEVEEILSGMKSRFNEYIGTIADDRIRNALFSWLISRHRITVRGSGGVYFIPRPKDDDDAKALEKEILAVREWVIKYAGGNFSVVEMSPSGLTSFDDILTAGVTEIKEELEQISNKIKSWRSNNRMNAGSRAVSTEMIGESISVLNKRILALQEAFGDELETISGMWEMVNKSNWELYQESRGAIKSKKSVEE